MVDWLSAGIGGLANIASAYIGSQGAGDAADRYTQQQQQGIQLSQEAVDTAKGEITATAQPGLDDLFTGFQGALTELEGTGSAEQQALAMASDPAGMGKAEMLARSMSGVEGQQAEQQAMDSFMESPGQQFLREQQEQALLRNQGAIGGLGGGRVRSALQDEAYGRAATNQQQRFGNIASLIQPEQQGEQQRFNNLASMINPAQQRSANIANTMSQGGQSLANYRSGVGQQLANVSMGGAAQQIPLNSAIGSAQAGGAIGQSAALQTGIQNTGKTLGEIFGQ
jgi:hypothetical protein